MFGLVARMLLLSPAAGTVYWTVDDAVQKSSADTETFHAQASDISVIQKSSSTVDHLLQGNQSTLALIQGRLSDAEKAFESAVIEVQVQKKRVEQATNEREAAKEKLQNVSAKARDAFSDVNQANVALKAAEYALPALKAEVQKAREALAKAERHLDYVISDKRNMDVRSASADAEDKYNALQVAQEELNSTEKSIADRSETLSEAVNKSRKREFEQQKAQKVFDDASAKLSDAERTLEEKVKRTPSPIMVQRLNSSFETQKRIVEDLESESASLHQKLQLKQLQHDALRETIAHDSICIQHLRNVHGQVQHAEAAYSATRHAYVESRSDDLLQAAWQAKDALDALRLNFYNVQKECAPRTVYIPASAEPPPVCNKDTGGTCAFFWCHKSRSAYCDRATWSCMCRSDSCANSTGQCWLRGQPPAATLEEPAVAEPAKAPTSGGPEICVVVLAVLIGMAAATVRMRSDSRNVMLSERLVE